MKSLCVVLFAIFMSGCATMLSPVSNINGEKKYAIVESDKSMWGAPAGTLFSDDKQSLFSVHKDIGIDNFLLGAFYTHISVKSSAENAVRDLKKDSSLDVKKIVLDEASNRKLNIDNKFFNVKIMPFNWININKDKTARLITLFEIEYEDASRNKKWTRVMRISGTKLPLGGENGWINENKNLLVDETEKNVIDIFDYLNKAFNGSIPSVASKQVRLKNASMPAITLPIDSIGSLIHETNDSYYILYAGGKLALSSGVAIYDKDDVSIVK